MSHGKKGFKATPSNQVRTEIIQKISAEEPSRIETLEARMAQVELVQDVRHAETMEILQSLRGDLVSAMSVARSQMYTSTVINDPGEDIESEKNKYETPPSEDSEAMRELHREEYGHGPLTHAALQGQSGDFILRKKRDPAKKPLTDKTEERTSEKAAKAKKENAKKKGNEDTKVTKVSKDNIYSAATGGNPDGGDDDSSSSDSSDSSSTKDSSDEEEDDAAPNRRVSYMNQLTNLTKDKDNYQDPAVMRMQPSFDHIFLERMNIKEFFEFLSALGKYRAKNNLDVKLVHQLSERVCQELFAHNPTLTLEKFYARSNKKIVRMIKYHIRPQTTIEFQNILTYYVEFRYDSKYPPTPTQFRNFYTSLLIYKDDFMRYYDLIAEDNNAIIPQCTDKEGGLIRIFTDKILFEYGKRVVKSMRKNKFSNIHDFMIKFYEYVEKDFNNSRSAKGINEHFGGTEYRNKLTNRSNTTSVPFYRKSSSEQPSSPQKNFNKAKSATPHRIHAISNGKDYDEDDFHMMLSDSYSTDSDEDILLPSSSNEEDHNNDESAVKDSSENHVEVTQDNESFTQEEAMNMYNALLSNMAQDSKTNARPRGCFYKVFNMECKSGRDCKYSHEHADLVKTYTYYSNALANSKFKPPNGASKTILKRDDHHKVK